MPTSDLIAGSISGFVSCVVLQPLEVIKTRLQQQNMRPIISGNGALTQTASTFKDVMRPLLLHPKTLWRGTVPTIFRNVPGISIYFYSLSFIRHSLVPDPKKVGLSSEYVTLVNIGAGAIARAGAGFILMPITIIKVRFESTLYNYKSLLEASTDIFRKEGLRGFFSGFGATALRDAPYAGLQVGLYEAMKSLLGASPLNSPSSGPLLSSSSGAIAGVLATTFTQPFDVIKTRIQLDPIGYKNLLYCSKKIWTEEGFKGFFKGMSPRLARKVASAAIVWTGYEEVLKALARRDFGQVGH